MNFKAISLLLFHIIKFLLSYIRIQQNISSLLKLIHMKSHQLFFALMYIIGFAACKKEDLLQARNNVVAQKDIDAIQNNNACRAIDPSNFVKHVNNPYFPL